MRIKVDNIDLFHLEVMNYVLEDIFKEVDV